MQKTDFVINHGIGLVYLFLIDMIGGHRSLDGILLKKVLFEKFVLLISSI